MATPARRHRSSTAASRMPAMNNQIAELRSLADELVRAAETPLLTPAVLQAQSSALRRMRQLLIESHEKTQTKDAFRHVHGFDVLLQTLRSLSAFYTPAISPPDRIDFFAVIKATLDVLSDALDGHSGNRRFFAKRVENGGWAALEAAVAKTGICGDPSGSVPNNAGQEQLFGLLFAFALGEEAMTRIFRDVDRPTENGDARVEVGALRDHMRKLFSGTEVLQNPDIVPSILHFWRALSSEDAQGTRSAALSLAVLIALLEIVCVSTHNKAAVHVTGVLSTILPLLFEDKCVPAEKCLLRELADILIEYGINKLDDAYYLFRKASTSAQAAEFLHQGMQTSRGPPFIQFDLSLEGFSAIELPELGRPFPPVSPGSGYTFAAWVRIDKHDPNCHTTIFGAYDDTQTCFLMAYLEKDTRCFILQTYMGHSAGIVPSVRFKKAPRFEQGKWYHIAVVHRRAKAIGLGSHKASLYINGEFTETMKAHYPSHPPLLDGSHESFASVSSNSSRQHGIFAFLGTPRNLAPRLGRNVLQSKLSIASFHLLSEPLSDELIAVYHKLGPRYSGNFQDRLGSFQTYRTSAELHVQNEILHPGREEQSDIVSAIRSKAGLLMPESKILLSFSPTSVLDDDDRNGIDESQLIRSLSKESAKQLHRFTRMHGTPIIVNAAVPSVNDALSQSRGFGRLSGNPVVVVPQSLDDTTWRIGGCAAVGLKLVQSARTLEEVLRAVKILLEAVEGNWRNCEAMEQNNGFAVLAEVLRQKIGNGPSMGTRSSSELCMTSDEREAFLLQLLRVILRFVGYDEAQPTESMIINPLAYRVLLVDTDLWRKSASLDTQKLYYQQFIHFAKGSKHHHYNAKRFHRIRVVKRLTDTLKGESFMPQMFPYFLEAFKVLLEINFNGENSRQLSLFITYALHDNRAAYAKQTLRPRTSVLRLRKNTAPTLTPGPTRRSISPREDQSQAAGVSLGELGVSVLRMLTELLCDDTNHHEIIRFAKNVTGKWLLYLIAEPDQRVVVMAAKIMARLLVANGPLFVKKFSEKGGGFVLMKHRLKKWWNTPGIWTICFAILFDRDVSTIDFERTFDVYNLVDIFIGDAPENLRIVYPEVFPVIVAMLDTGLRAIVRDQGKRENEPTTSGNNQTPVTRGRRRTMSLKTKQAPLDPNMSQSDRLNDYAGVLHSAIQFLKELHTRCGVFRDYAVSSNYIQELLFVLYPLIVTSDSVSAETELNSRGSALTFEGHDVVIKPLSRANERQAPVIRTAKVTSPPSPSPHRVVPFRRASSFVLVSADKPKSNSQPSRLNPILSSPRNGSIPMKVGSSVVEAMVEVVLDVFQDQLFCRKDFPGLGLFLRTPPGFQEHQAYFESYILRQTLSSVTNALQQKPALLHEPRILTNLSRFVTHVSEAVFEGWFLQGAEPLLDFAGFLLEYLERPDISGLKSVRLCTQAVGIIRGIFLRVVLLRLAEPDDSEGEYSTVAIIEKMIYWQPIILSSENLENLFLRLISYLLYTKLSSGNEAVRLAAANFWRLLLVQKPDDTSAILTHAVQADKKELYQGFKKLTELDNETFLLWFDKNQTDLDAFFYGTMTRNWEDFAHEQNKKTEDASQKRIARRREKLKQWHNDDIAVDRIWTSHETSTNHWRSNIHAAERIRHQRVLQDQQENITFLSTVMARLDKQLRGPCALFESSPAPKWRLDETESRDRKRMRTIIDSTSRDQKYQPKRRDTDPIAYKLKVDTTVPRVSTPATVGVTPIEPTTMRPSSAIDPTNDEAKDDGSDSDVGEDFEMVEAMLEDDDGFEDKNRKVMRSLNRGDQVQYVCNVSRVVGLEAIEGLLIVGKDYLYLLDDFFQRSDGEIVRVWQAPPDERDIYVQLIAGDKVAANRRLPRDEGDAARNWKWAEVISISKRHFLHRDVAIEIFFDDGRSYLLTATSSTSRNAIHSRLIARAPQVVKPEFLAHSEISWRLDSLRNPEEAPQTFGSRFASAFSANSPHPSTKRWLKGEISNFHYLMFINTLAGRSFNDLTQYPVFPWVIADYTSEVLDLTNPRTFRDFRRPIGCQNPVAEQNVRERYDQLVEMGDEHPWHYGTHYSSATTVASYLVRLQPFCAAFTLIHDRKFDHADRMFHSIANAWNSTSRANSADVRELTPEFFYLPEFLTNLNGYDFGVRFNGESVDNVALPPWAKGDPAIFIAKQREALESPYVSEHLHHWIDLIFGYQQRGEAAVEAANVYQHTTYQGIVDVDLLDEDERARHVQSVNNFGQTPSQVFQRPHPQKEASAGKLRRLDTSAESLIRVPGALLETQDRISSLAYIPKHDKLLCSAPFRHNIPPHYDRYMEWGFTDGSVRFYESHSKKLLGLFEHLHAGQLTTSLFVDGRTLITAGTDCTVAIWNVVKADKNVVDLPNETILFGHRSPVITLAASAAFKSLLSASTDGKVFLWDLNRSEFVREVDLGPTQKQNPVPIQAARINNVTGHIVLACGPRLIVTTLNGRLLMEQDVCVGDEDADGITALAVYEGVGNEWCERELIFTGHRRGCVKIFQLAPDRTGEWTITLLKLLNHTDSSREDGKNVAAPITCILPMPHNVYTGDDDGRVVRSTFFDLKPSEWTRRKLGWEGQVEWKGGKRTGAVMDLPEEWNEA